MTARATLPTLPEPRADADALALAEVRDALAASAERVARVWPRGPLRTETVIKVVSVEHGIETMMGRVRG